MGLKMDGLDSSWHCRLNFLAKTVAVCRAEIAGEPRLHQNSASRHVVAELRQ